MLVILIVLIIAAAAYVFIARRQTRSDLLESQTPKHLNGEDLRPLFAPDESELHAVDQEERTMAAETAKEETRLAAERKLANFTEFRQTWRESPGRTNTIELLLRASQMENGQLYQETVNEILHKRPDGLSDAELANLIESHFWLLPQTERTPGITFTINRELAAIRSGSKAKSEEEASNF